MEGFRRKWGGKKLCSSKKSEKMKRVNFFKDTIEINFENYLRRENFS